MALEKLKESYEKAEIPCEICGSSDLEMFQKRGRTAEPGVYGDMPIMICKCCGFKMQNPRYEDDFYKEYYDIMYREVAFGATRPSDEYVEQQKDRGKKVMNFAHKHGVTTGKMLDHGCASGATMLGWIEEGWEAVGIDPHRPSVEEAKSMGLNVQVGAGESLPFDNNEFDLLLSLGSFEHSYNLKASMTEAHRVLKTGGKLVIRWRSNEIFGSPLEYYNHNHYRFFTRETWILCLKINGFDVDVMSDERVEGWDSYEYIIATKTVDDLASINRDEILKEHDVDDYQAELKLITDIRDNYYASCKKFIALHEQYKDDPEGLVTHMRSGQEGFKWGWLGGHAKDVVARSLKEANLYIGEYDAGRVQ